ncbi:MAG TPA: lasso peptide biosynthesis B2 protein [Vicinamibacterales bacterium]|nr:lasso peptide biosynthesis B2 protein [Vicinamibacterales bacterium]
MLEIRALVWLLISAAALRARPYDRIARRWLQASGSTARDDARARRIALAVHRAARVVRPRPSCLARALAAGRLLARERLDARVIIGVTPGAGVPADFAAHAWLTHGALVLSGAEAGRVYLPLCAIDAASRPVFVTLP